MKTIEKVHRRPIYGIIVGWIYRRLGYETQVIIRFFPDIMGLPTDAKLVLQCTKEID